MLVSEAWAAQLTLSPSAREGEQGTKTIRAAALKQLRWGQQVHRMTQTTARMSVCMRCREPTGPSQLRKCSQSWQLLEAMSSVKLHIVIETSYIDRLGLNKSQCVLQAQCSRRREGWSAIGMHVIDLPGSHQSRSWTPEQWQPSGDPQPPANIWRLVPSAAHMTPTSYQASTKACKL